MVKIEINDNQYSVQSLKTLPTAKYFEAVDYAKDLTNIESFRSFLGIITNIPKETLDLLDIDMFSAADFRNILGLESDDTEIIDSFKKNNINELNELTAGAYRDVLDLFGVDLKESAKISGIVAVVLLNGHEYTKSTFTLTRDKVLSDMPINETLAIYSTFENWFITLQKHYSGLFDEAEEKKSVIEEEEEIEEEDSGNEFGFTYAILNACNENALNRARIESLTIIDFMEWLSFNKYKSDNEKKTNDAV